MNNIMQIISTLKIFLYKSEEFTLYDILNHCNPSTTLENIDLGTQYYTLMLNLDMDYFSKISGEINLIELEDNFLGYLGDILRGETQQVAKVFIKPIIKTYINWDIISDLYDKETFIKDINKIMDILIEVSTGVNIGKLNNEYITIYNNLKKSLKKLGIENPNPYDDLWKAYSYWSAKLPTYAARRTYFSSIYKDILNILEESGGYDELSLQLEYTGWEEVDRKIAEIKKQFKEAENEEQFNAIGAICRSTYISLANKIYDANIHKTIDGVVPSSTDYKRKLEAFINYELSGATNEKFRSHCKKTLDLADELTHKTTANKKQTALTITALISVVNIIEILNGNEIKL